MTFTNTDQQTDIILQLDNYQEFLTILDLVNLGLFSSEQTCYKMRRLGHSPPYIQIAPKVIRFPKKLLIKWIDDNLKNA